MKIPLALTRRPAALLILWLAVGAPLLRAADPAAFPPTAPDANHQPPTLVHRIEPLYPAGVDEARERRVYVAFIVGPDGAVRSASAMFAPPQPFAVAAVEAVNQWKFEPGRISASKRPVSTQMTVELWFKPPAADAKTPPPTH